MRPLAVLSVASEIFPLVKTGGLADVTGALPGALAEQDVAVRTLIPGYPSVIGALERGRTVREESDFFGGRARLLAGHAAGLDLLVLDAPHLYERPGNPYLGPDGRDWPDNAIRFAALSRMAADIGGGALKDYPPKVVHAHDWQAGLVPAYLHYGGGQRPGTVMTVHNLSFQGKAPRELLASLGLPPNAWSIEGVEFHGSISLLKAGMQFADRITTVSPTYAAEILTPEAGMGFDGLLRARADAVSGILNGIDTAIWNPAHDKLIAAHFDRAGLAKRAANKTELRARMGLEQDAQAPLFGVVSRLTWQKGMDLLIECLPVLRGLGAQLALVGAGDADMEAAFRAAAAAAPDRIGCVIGYDEALAHVVQAGADALLVPSRFEPCGLTQLCALRYGAVPVVARVGGLADTVIDANPAALAAGAATGVQFAPISAEGLAMALRRTAALYREADVWRSMQRNGMATDVSWRGPAHQYATLFRGLVQPAARQFSDRRTGVQ
jgi:starch synthase